MRSSRCGLRTATGEGRGWCWKVVGRRQCRIQASIATWAGADGGGVVVPLPTAGVGDGDSFLERLSGCW